MSCQCNPLDALVRVDESLKMLLSIVETSKITPAIGPPNELPQRHDPPALEVSSLAKAFASAALHPSTRAKIPPSAR